MLTQHITVAVKELQPGVVLADGGTVLATTPVGAFIVGAVQREVWSLATGTQMTTCADQVWHVSEEVLITVFAPAPIVLHTATEVVGRLALARTRIVNTIDPTMPGVDVKREALRILDAVSLGELA